MNDEIVVDVNGNEIKIGDVVEWTDPENESVSFFTVVKINGEILTLVNDETECEAFGHECKVPYENTLN